ncbi:hypothetical protein BgiMline_011698 [Biomphalaria glabrata]|uniref:Uncharacterized protein LOC106054107 n=1 Tax=Biomphalaria glabrata TaxID=6526 RepID=A0A9W3A736_BIOGL|nr:uncharacterized protein LOC106054107 [Biomphalaria glabrata]KAI8733228.1 ras guanine nucleotide exchange factor L-like [Biomphalaria glabrata]
MGNIEAHDFAPVRADERKVLNLSRTVTPKQYVKHLQGELLEGTLHELPWNIKDSVSLYESMTVAFNALTEIPVELPLRLPHLSYLNLSHNLLTTLPESFGLLFHLKEVCIQHNQLTSMPDSFVFLVKLEKVDFSYNQLRQLPENIGTMEKLEKINLTHNKLKQLPLSFGSPQSKVQLLLAYQNRLESPPQAVCDEGSSSTLEYVRKQYATNCAEYPTSTVVPLNQFPRCCSNKLEPSVSNPHSAQIQYIQQQTNTSHTTNRIKAPLLPPFDATTLTPFQLQDRVIGLIYGAAIGDAIGLACRWMSKDEVDFHYGSDEDLVYEKIVQDEHRVLWRQGDWTSNFDQFMLVTESLVNWAGVVDELEFARRLQTWANQGFKELGDSVGVVTSETLAKVLSHPDFTKDPHTVSKSVLTNNQATSNGHMPLGNLPATMPSSNSSQHIPRLSSSSSSLPSLSSLSHKDVVQKLVYTAPCDTFGVDNGAVVRTAILGVPYFHELIEVESNAVRICRTTHADNKCVASCVLISLLVALQLQGKLIDLENKLSLNEDHLDLAFKMAATHLSDAAEIQDFMELKNYKSLSSLNTKTAMSHTYLPVKAALIALHWTGDFRSCIAALTRLAGDSNSNACVAGAILGCCWGYAKLPVVWVDNLRKKQVQWLNMRINHLLDIMGSP